MTHCCKMTFSILKLFQDYSAFSEFRVDCGRNVKTSLKIIFQGSSFLELTDSV